jgi:phosphotransferase system IIB component
VTDLAADTVRLRLTVWQESKADADRAAAGLRFALEEQLKAAGLGPGGDTPPPAS